GGTDGCAGGPERLPHPVRVATRSLRGEHAESARGGYSVLPPDLGYGGVAGAIASAEPGGDGLRSSPHHDHAKRLRQRAFQWRYRGDPDGPGPGVADPWAAAGVVHGER